MLLSNMTIESIILKNIPIHQLPKYLQDVINNVDEVTAFLDYKSKKLLAHYIRPGRLLTILCKQLDNKVLSSIEFIEICEWLEGHNIQVDTELLNHLNPRLSNTDDLLDFACENGNLDIVKYLHEKLHLTLDDFRSRDNGAIRSACYRGNYDIVKYLREKVELTRDDFRADDNYALMMACQNGHYNIVKYLRERVQLTADDFRSDFNYALMQAIINRHTDVVDYIMEIVFQQND